MSQRDYSPVSWAEYFDEAHDILIGYNSQDRAQGELGNTGERLTPQAEENEEDSFRVYLKNFHPPYAPTRKPGERLDPEKTELTTAELDTYSKVPTLVSLHGGGYSGLTWAQFAKEIEQMCECRILAIDLRSHGDTKTSDDNQMDINTLVSDVISVTHNTHRICGFSETPKIVIIGHSMGGAIAVNCATRCTEFLPSLAGFVIIDVVEGTAKDALPLMMSVIKTRPTRFPSLCNAIEWCVRSGMAKNSSAARVSMPGNLVNISNGQLAIHDVPERQEQKNEVKTTKDCWGKLRKHKFHISVEQLIGQSPPSALILPPRLPLPPRIANLKGYSSSPLPASQTLPLEPSVRDSISEEPEQIQKDTKGFGDEEKKETLNREEDEETKIYKRPPDVEKSGYSWRTNLAKTQPFWDGWFDGLSNQLLNAPVQGKFLLLAGIDRLDKTLTIGHMQGKFMMKVLPKCGHAVHEDLPEQVASAIGDFLVRNKFASST